MAKGNPYSFLHVNKPEIDLDEQTDPYSIQVYQKGKDNIEHFIKNSWIQQDDQSRFYIYSQEMNGRVQYGLVGASSVDDYEQDIIKKHEKTLKKKEEDRTKIMDYQSANTGPVFLTYKKGDSIKEKINHITKKFEPYTQIKTEDLIIHTLWKIENKENQFFENEFKNIENTYIADGHHRSAASYNVGKLRKQRAVQQKKLITGDEDFNYFMSILYPEDQLEIMEYNRVIKSLNSLTEEQFISQLKQKVFDLEKLKQVNPVSKSDFENLKPRQKHECTMKLGKDWYRCQFKQQIIDKKDPVKSLDVQILNDYVLDQVLGIKDVRNDNRVDFIGGIRGVQELEKRCQEDCIAAFAMYPVKVEDLMKVADKNQIMPPKSTWFEPKPRDGQIVRRFND